ncbi:phytanoyl-CoA dioxygenase family protein [Bosea sp. BK604]|uniref:phytanoyl-CoA dioxygenase family protein n=1 Tax=Bosea sp. BK604 TaxID=2512180 RepID=UPI0010433F02|nr:phytanoyl-CoA dioxygenase family protein [Bosea sp. BK604]TCR70275.1 phytanoyl-CoA dioxygenase PhyH [Bosea sp. BK604]
MPLGLADSVLEPLPEVEARDRFIESGVAVVGGVVDETIVGACLSGFEALDPALPGQRVFNLDPASAALVGPAGALGRLARALMGPQARPARILKFDKTPESNWRVPWHQDRVIAVAERIEVAGFGPWSEKGGVAHVEPPEDMLLGMVALRLHLDDCPVENGALEVAAGSFRRGRVVTGEIAGIVEQSSRHICVARAGDVVAMRGLSIHASAKAAQPSRRRVLHVDYATMPLPQPLRWALPDGAL